MNTFFRKSNSDRNGNGFSELVIQQVWIKGRIVPGYDPNVYRKDSCGAWMRRTDYGNTNSNYGWEIDHIKPVSLGGGDNLDNLQPLLWQNNRYKSDSFPNWYCKIRA